MLVTNVVEQWKFPAVKIMSQLAFFFFFLKDVFVVFVLVFVLSFLLGFFVCVFGFTCYKIVAAEKQSWN